MIRGLVVVAAGGALLAVVALSLSGGINPKHWHLPGGVWTINDDDDDNGPPLRLTGNEPVISRDLPWAGGDHLSFDVPAKISYAQGPTVKITLTGPDALVDHVTLKDNTVSIDRSVHSYNSDHPLQIAITAPSLHDFELDAANSLDIQSISADALQVTIAGAGKVEAHGTVRSMKMEIDGAGKADLSGLTVTDAQVEINGLGKVEVGPTGNAHVEINGAGKVSLTKRPAHLDQEINGAGKVEQPDPAPGQSL